MRYHYWLPLLLLVLSCTSGRENGTANHSGTSGRENETANHDWVDQNSQIHNLRIPPHPRMMGQKTIVFVEMLDRKYDMWRRSWRVSGGTLGSDRGADIGWDLPMDTLAWVELTLRKGFEKHVCRRIVRLIPRSIGTDLKVEVRNEWTGVAAIQARMDNFPHLMSSQKILWGVDSRADPRQLNLGYSLRTKVPGRYRVWARVESDGMVESDTVVVEVRSEYAWEPDSLSIHVDESGEFRLEATVWGKAARQVEVRLKKDLRHTLELHSGFHLVESLPHPAPGRIRLAATGRFEDWKQSPILVEVMFRSGDRWETHSLPLYDGEEDMAVPCAGDFNRGPRTVTDENGFHWRK